MYRRIGIAARDASPRAPARRVARTGEVTNTKYFLDGHQKRLKDLGATNVCFDLEVWNEELWPTLLPGKSKAVSRKEWVRRLEDAVDIFGRGHLGSNFVSGL